MHFYQFNIGDYRKDTSHLSILEHGVYRLLLDTYYATELPLTTDIRQLSRMHCLRSADEKAALDVVLSDFFLLTESGYRHNGCDKVLAKVYEKSEKARQSAQKKWDRAKKKKCERIEKECERIKNGCERIKNACEQDALDMLPNTHNPIPITQYPEKQSPPAGSSVEKWHAATCDLPVTINPTAWIAWCKYKSESKKPIKQTTAKLQWEFLAAYSNDSQLEIVEQSIRSGWQGLFEPKKRIESATEFIDRHTDTSWRDELNNTPSIPAIEFYGDKKTGG